MYKWEEKHSVGIQSIDLQHQELFKLLNKLLDALKRGVAAEVSNQLIFELERYAIMHFQKEEFFFQRFNYPGAEEHIKEHKLFIEKIQTLKADIKSGKVAVSLELLTFLRNWIEHHIVIVDKKYADCFHQNGLK